MKGNISMEKILITGGAGFIGSHLAGLLLEMGNKVTCVDNFELGKKVSKSDADYAIFYGDEMKNAYLSCKENKKSFWSNKIDEISDELESSVCNGDLILLKASKGMELWRVADALGIELGGHA